MHLYGASSADRIQELTPSVGVLYSARPAALARARQILDQELRPMSGPEDPGLCLLTSLGHLLPRLSAG